MTDRSAQPPSTPSSPSAAASGERTDLLELLQDERTNFRYTTAGLTSEQARARSTVSELTVGGLVKHLAQMEREYCAMITAPDPEAAYDLSAVADAYSLRPEESWEATLAEWEAASAATDELVRTLPDLDVRVPLPTAPWAPERRWWSARHIVLHLLRETAHHAGHADIIREALDGGNTTRAMGEAAGLDFSTMDRA
jgi:uncharacterized damage-inducible protein DinB